MPPRRVIVHAGFHKTGTTSAQRFLLANGKYIWPRCAMVLPGRLRGGAATLAVRYSRFPTKVLLDSFAADLRATLAAINAGEKRSILISDENLAGRMPGRDGQVGYTATPALMAQAEQVIHDVFGTSDITYHFTTRQPDDWLHSTYRHNLRTSRLTLDWDDYAAGFGPAADLDGVVRAVQEAVTGRVQAADLGALDGPEGPAAPLLDLIALPDHLRRNLAPNPMQNQGPDTGLAAQLLDLNRSALSDDAVAAAKALLLIPPEDNND